MSTYKARIRKQRNKKLFIGLGAAIALVFIFGTIMVLGKKQVNSTNIYDQVEQIQYEDLFNIEEDEYLVYIYAPTCSYCEDIKDDLKEYHEKADRIKVYTINTARNGGIFIDEQYKVSAVGKTEYTQVKIVGTPALFVIKDGVVLYEVSGSEDIPALFKNYLNKQGK